MPVSATASPLPTATGADLPVYATAARLPAATRGDFPVDATAVPLFIATGEDEGPDANIALRGDRSEFQSVDNVNSSGMKDVYLVQSRTNILDIIISGASKR